MTPENKFLPSRIPKPILDQVGLLMDKGRIAQWAGLFGFYSFGFNWRLTCQTPLFPAFAYFDRLRKLPHGSPRFVRDNSRKISFDQDMIGFRFPGA
jgi:hypothetical protein